MTDDQLITVHGDVSSGGIFNFEQPTWRVREPEHFRRCSYCGSMHPEDFVTEARGGAQVDRSVDWKYGWPHKVYVHVPNPNPDALFCVGSISEAKVGAFAPGGERYTPPGDDYIAVADLTPEQLAIAKRDGSYRDRDGERVADYFRFGTRRDFFGKYYAVHACDPWVTEELRTEIAYHTGYIVSTTDEGRVQWRAYNYG